MAGAPPDERAGLRDRRGELRLALAELPWSEELATAVGEHLSHVTSRLERLEGETAAAPSATREAMELRGDLSWLPLTFPEGALEETILSLEAEVEALAVASREAGVECAAAQEEAVAALTKIKRNRLRRTADMLEEDEAEAKRLWRAYLEARELRARGGVGQNTARRLRDLLLARIETMEADDAADRLCRCGAEYDDMSLDLLALQTETPPLQAAENLDDGRKEMVWLRTAIRDAWHRPEFASREMKASRRALKQCSRRLRQASGRLSREEQELRLQARLEGLFGRGFVVFFEKLILWLIVAVLGVLVVEGFLPPGSAPWFSELAWPDQYAQAQRWQPVHVTLGWIDAGICAIFLLEFFVKLALVQGRRRWFVRHFLVDFIPSIPFGLLTVHAFDILRTLRVVRFARLSRMMRFVRAARPIVRFLRFFGFLQRAMDRMVRLHGGLLNRNIVFFEPENLEEDEPEFADLKTRMRQTRALARRVWRQLAPGLGVEQRGERLTAFLHSLPPREVLDRLPASTEPAERRAGGLVRAEQLVDRLTECDPGTVEAEVGGGGARRIALSLQRLDVPLLRRLPGLKQMVAAARRGEPLERVAAAAKALGRYLERRLSIAHWVSDLSGVITGPQFLDRLSSAMVQATARPAKRLILFGLGFLLLKGFVHLLSWGALEGVADWLGKTLGLPFLILGAFCLAILLLGMWFKRIAGEATDFYARTAEAQYINLLKSAKLAHVDEDLEILWRRSLRPEAVLFGDSEPEDPAPLQDAFERRHTSRGSLDSRGHVLQLYLDYLDGALFHITDTKTTSQLLGNLALENIRTERLATSRRERRRLFELDLDRERSSLRGPYFWFRSVTHSVAQWTAKLILEYNRRAIPQVERADYPEETVRAMDDWLATKLRGGRPEAPEGGRGGAFLTTQFSALHFLTADEERDAAIAERFGERTIEALRADRQTMIRTIFGTYPFHRLPRPDRTVNPFELYSRHLAGGRVLFFPLYFLKGAWRIFRWLLRRILETIREILNPARLEETGRENWAGFEVALRKIHRMRKPLFMECARFRTRFDPEYLGLVLYPGEDSGVEGRTFREDLERIDARDDEWDEFLAIRKDREEAFRELAALTTREGGPEALVARLRTDSGSAPWREAYRAIAVAYAIDYRGARSLARLEERFADHLEELVDRRGRIPGTGLLRRALWLIIPAQSLSQAFEEFLGRFSPRELDARERRWLWRAVRADWHGLRRRVLLAAALEPGASPKQASRRLLQHVARHPESWSEQLLTLRTVQSLSILDVRNYRRQVWALGGYGLE